MVDNFHTIQAHYIPHWAVSKNSATMPVHTIYNCSCKQLSGHPSLKDCLHVGPPFLKNLSPYFFAFACMSVVFQMTLRKHFSMSSWMSQTEITLAFSGCLIHKTLMMPSNFTISRLFCLALGAYPSCLMQLSRFTCNSIHL